MNSILDSGEETFSAKGLAAVEENALAPFFEKLNVRTRAQLVKIALEQYRDQL